MDVGVSLCLVLQLGGVSGEVILDLVCLLVEVEIVHLHAALHSKAEDRVFNHLCEVEGPLDVAGHQVEQVSWVLLDPLTQSIVIICG